MDVLSLLPGIRIQDAASFSRDRRSGQMQSGSQRSPESRQDRDASFEEILLSNPAALASDSGMQWMYMTYARY